jgi:hypothetical protein
MLCFKKLRCPTSEARHAGVSPPDPTKEADEKTRYTESIFQKRSPRQQRKTRYTESIFQKPSPSQRRLAGGERNQMLRYKNDRRPLQEKAPCFRGKAPHPSLQIGGASGKDDNHIFPLH